MYLSLRSAPSETTLQGVRDTRFRVSPNVLGLGMTSLLSDVSSEMVNSVLPLYLTFQLGFSPFALGTFDGAYQAVSALTALGGAAIADRRRRHRDVAAAGYAASTACKVGLLAFRGAWAPATAFLYLDRGGKGIRTAPRDALISLSSEPAALGRAFGVHRALDTAGALLGPLVAFLLLSLSPGDYGAVFVASVGFGLLGVAVILLYVANVAGRADPAAPGRRLAGTVTLVAGLLRTQGYRRVVLAGALLSVVTLSDPLVYFTIDRRSDLHAALFPLLYVGTALVYLLLAVPVGRLADRVGRPRVLVAGFGLLAGTYLLLGWAAVPGALTVLAALALLGAFHATNDGILAAVGASVLPEASRTTGLATLNGAVAVAGFVSSLGFGAAWDLVGSRTAIRWYLCALVVAVALGAVLLRRVSPAAGAAGGRSEG